MNDKAFLDDVCAHPDDDTTRLVYADWLDDNGDPEHAEFLRAGVALGRVGEDWRFVPAEQLHLWRDPGTYEDRYADPARLAARMTSAAPPSCTGCCG